MTIMEAIEQADKEKPNTIDMATKERWIYALESHIQQELQIHSIGSTLSVREPYAVMYPKYLILRICLENGELDKYNNAAATFHHLWMAFVSDVQSTKKIEIVPDQDAGDMESAIKALANRCAFEPWHLNVCAVYRPGERLMRKVQNSI